MSEWSDWLGAQTVEAQPHTPASLDELVQLVGNIAADADFVRGVGVGHSTSPVAQPMQRGHYVDMRKLNRALTWDYYASDRVDPDFPFLRVEAGIALRDLNKLLDRSGWAMATLGSYDEQTISGAISTATHGSGIGHSPICDLIEAIEIVTLLDGKAQLVRIEPSDGVTDADTYGASASPMPLIQEDDAFYSAVVGLGMFGVVYAVTLRARAHFWLHEHRSLMIWDELKPQLQTLVAQNQMYFDVTFLPHTLVDDYAGKILCQLTTREELPYQPNPPARRDYGDALAMVVAVVGTGLLEWLALNLRQNYKRDLIAAFRARGDRPVERFVHHQQDEPRRQGHGHELRAVGADRARGRRDRRAHRARGAARERHRPALVSHVARGRALHQAVEALPLARVRPPDLLPRVPAARERADPLARHRRGARSLPRAHDVDDRDRVDGPRQQAALGPAQLRRRGARAGSLPEVLGVARAAQSLRSERRLLERLRHDDALALIIPPAARTTSPGAAPGTARSRRGPHRRARRSERGAAGPCGDR